MSVFVWNDTVSGDGQWSSNLAGVYINWTVGGLPTNDLPGPADTCVYGGGTVKAIMNDGGLAVDIISCDFPVSLNYLTSVKGSFPTGCTMDGALLDGASTANFAGTFTLNAGASGAITCVDVTINGGTFSGYWTGTISNDFGTVSGATAVGDSAIIENNLQCNTVYGRPSYIHNKDASNFTGDTETDYFKLENNATVSSGTIDTRGGTLDLQSGCHVDGGLYKADSNAINFGMTTPFNIYGSARLEIYKTIDFDDYIVDGLVINPLTATDNLAGAAFGSNYTVYNTTFEAVITVLNIPDVFGASQLN